ncbi:hypothetical protein F4775DRAFT_573531 [Biscogniauxia sp. FL1348]|nr:hypothetical protein F4775DRAFT_573531 [Biscogniauxia sp. FL1348]
MSVGCRCPENHPSPPPAAITFLVRTRTGRSRPSRVQRKKNDYGNSPWRGVGFVRHVYPDCLRRRRHTREAYLRTYLVRTYSLTHTHTTTNPRDTLSSLPVDDNMLTNMGAIPSDRCGPETLLFIFPEQKKMGSSPSQHPTYTGTSLTGRYICRSSNNNNNTYYLVLYLTYKSIWSCSHAYCQSRSFLCCLPVTYLGYSC